ncbi:MAG: hypothetical protein U9R38_06815 [Candidatus Margulisiibacteriota bacterium]|nr:hypothetical protein [Candidatus Margulisiibacteriota bacterium]
MRKIIFSFLFLLIFVAASFAAPVNGEPYHISFQGKLEGVADPANVSVKFDLYDAPTGGDSVWTETHSGLTLDNGIFNVLLGKSGSLLGDLADATPLWMEVVVDGGDPLIPRQALTAAPYSFSARNLRGGNIVFENTGAYPDPQPGMMAYNSDRDKVAVYDNTGSKWVEIDPVYVNNPILSSPRIGTSGIPGATSQTISVPNITDASDIILTGLFGWSDWGLNSGTIKIEILRGAEPIFTYYNASGEREGLYFAFPIPIRVPQGTSVSVRGTHLNNGYANFAYNLNYMQLPLQ